MQEIICPIILCAVAAIIMEILGGFIAKFCRVTYSNYGILSYFKWNTVDSIEDIKANINLVCYNYRYWFEKYTSVKVFIFVCVFWIFVGLYFLFKKKYKKAVYSIGIIVASVMMYIITCNGGLPLRIFTVWYISVVGAFIFVYDAIDNLSNLKMKQWMKVIYLIISFFVYFILLKRQMSIINWIIKDI